MQLFHVDERISSTCIDLMDGPLSQVFLKNEAHIPWLILVPRVTNVQEMYQLSTENRALLMEEIAFFSKIMNDYFKADKLNVGALGNMVTQLHIHIVARFKNDIAWPYSIWQANLETKTYPAEELQNRKKDLCQYINHSYSGKGF